MSNIESIIQQGECETCEFKASFSKAVIESLVAFANTRGETVYVGVSDDAKISGVAINEESIQNWLNEIKQKTEPSLVPNVDVYEADGKTAVGLSIFEFPVKPVAMQGRYYKRIHNSNHILSADEITEMRMYCLNISFDSFIVQSRFADLDTKATEYFIKLNNETGKFQLSGNIENDFNKLGVIDGQKNTRAAELLFGQHHTSIHLGRFKNPTTIIDDLEIRTPLVFAIDEAMAFIKKNIGVEYLFTGEIQRQNRWQYPLQAIRELLLNAIVHKDYRDNTDVIVKIFDNYIEISNPSNFYGNISPGDLKTDSYKPKHRNRLLVEMFYLMGAIEKYGTGIMRVKKWLLDYPELQFSIISRSGSIVATLSIINNDVGNHVGNQLSDLQQKIISAIKYNRNNTIVELAMLTETTSRTIERNLAQLKEMNILKRIGSRKDGYWEIE